MPDAICVSELTKFYKSFQALSQISFSVPQGDFFGFLGPNGAGKTTTIHAITGLANFQQGHISVFGFDVMREYRKTRALVGFVPQEFNFDPYLSVEQILVFEGGYFGMLRKEAKERALELLSEFNLLGHKHLDYRKLSGGMKRRLLIARALMHRPKILILDEPTAGVDLELRIKLWEFLKDLNEKGTTIFLTTHYIEEAERLCKRIGIIHKGKMIAVDETKKLIEKMGRQIVKIRLNQPFQEIPNFLQGFSLELIKEEGAFRFKNDHSKIANLLKAIHDSDFSVVDIETETTSLEDIFLEMTKA